MKKILIILFVFISLIGKSQSYTVPTGLSQKFTSTWYWFKSPSGYVLVDTALMFQSSDTIMKPTYNAIKFKNNVPYYWDLTKWNVFGSGGGGGNQTTTFDSALINQGSSPMTYNGTTDFNGTSWTISNANRIDINSADANSNISALRTFGFGADMEAFGINTSSFIQADTLRLNGEFTSTGGDIYGRFVLDADSAALFRQSGSSFNRVKLTNDSIIISTTSNKIKMSIDSVAGAFNILWMDASGFVHKGSVASPGATTFDASLAAQAHTNMTYNDSTFFNSTKWYLKDILFQGNGSVSWDARISAVTKNVSIIHADTMKLSADNKMILEGVTGVNIISTDSISGISTNVLQWTSSKSTLRGSTLASINYNTNSGDTIGWRMQSAGMFFRGGAFSSAATNKVAQLDTSTGKLSWGVPSVIMGGTGLTSLSQGDIIYGSAANTFSALAKNTTATRYLSNTGTSNNPAWAQVDLTNGVTGNLPVTNLNSGTNASSSRVWTGDGTWSFPPLTLGNIGASPNAAGMSYSSGTLTLQPASFSFGGIWLTTTQSLVGDKTIGRQLDNSVSYILTVGSATAQAVKTSSGICAPLRIVNGPNTVFGSSTTDYYGMEIENATTDNGGMIVRNYGGINISEIWSGGALATLNTGMWGVQGQFQLIRSGGSTKNVPIASMFHVIAPTTTTADVFDEYSAMKIDSVPASMVSTALPYGILQIGTTDGNFFAGTLRIGYGASGEKTSTPLLTLGSGTTARSSLSIELGVAPTSPVNGNIWNETTNNRLMLRKNGTTEEFLSTSAVNSISPTSPNRTIQVVINGTTYYIAAKTTND